MTAYMGSVRLICNNSYTITLGKVRHLKVRLRSLQQAYLQQDKFLDGRDNDANSGIGITASLQVRETTKRKTHRALQ